MASKLSVLSGMTCGSIFYFIKVFTPSGNTPGSQRFSAAGWAVRTLQRKTIRFIFAHAGGTIPMLADRISQYSSQMVDLAVKVPNGVEFELKRLYYDIASSANPAAMAALMP